MQSTFPLVIKILCWKKEQAQRRLPSTQLMQGTSDQMTLGSEQKKKALQVSKSSLIHFHMK